MRAGAGDRATAAIAGGTELCKESGVSLRQKIDALTSAFTHEIIRLIRAAPLTEILPARAVRELARAESAREAVRTKVGRDKPARAKRGAAARPRRASVKPPPAVVETRRPSRVPEPPAAKPVTEKAVLGVLHGPPMTMKAMLEALGVGSDQSIETMLLVDGLVERGLVGRAAAGAETLFFPKKKERRTRARREVPKIVAQPEAPTSEPQPTWKPTVIRRKKASADSAPESAPPASAEELEG